MSHPLEQVELPPFTRRERLLELLAVTAMIYLAIAVMAA
jgi:hypothetical protein